MRRRNTRGHEGQSHRSSVSSSWNEKWLSGGEKRRLPSRECERRKHKQVPKIESEEERTAGMARSARFGINSPIIAAERPADWEARRRRAGPNYWLTRPIIPVFNQAETKWRHLVI